MLQKSAQTDACTKEKVVGHFSLGGVYERFPWWRVFIVTKGSIQKQCSSLEEYDSHANKAAKDLECFHGLLLNRNLGPDEKKKVLDTLVGERGLFSPKKKPEFFSSSSLSSFPLNILFAL